MNGGGAVRSPGIGRATRSTVDRGALFELLATPPAVAAFGIYLILSLVLVGGPVLTGSSNQCICLGQDEGIFIWAFAWWPHAIAHGLNPFHPNIIYAPQGFDIALGALIPGAALLLAPVTAIAGPLFSYNLTMLMCPVLGAFFAFLLCRRITGRFWPSLFGGWVFGFSPFMFGALAGHMQLTLIFLAPAIVHIVVRGLAGELSPTRFVVLLVVTLAFQFLFGAEEFVSFTLFGAIALALGFVLGNSEQRAAVRGVVVPIALAYLITAVIVSPYLYYAFQPGGLPILLDRTDMFSNDLLAFVTPLPDIALGGSTFASTSSHFTAGWIEGGAYFGLPLIALICLGAVKRWRRLDGKVMVLTFAIVLICSLGDHLHVNGSASIPLPWAVGHHLPVLGLALPSRFVAYCFLIGGILAAIWLAQTTRRVVGWSLAALSIVFLWPAIGQGFWRGTPDLPPLFTNAAYRNVITPKDTALLLPVGGSGNSMLWQAETGLRFKMASGYVVPPEAPDPYKNLPIYPTLTGGAPIPDETGAAATFLYTHHVTVAVIDPTESTAAPWVPLLQRLGWKVRHSVARSCSDRDRPRLPSRTALVFRPGSPSATSPDAPPRATSDGLGPQRHRGATSDGPGPPRHRGATSDRRATAATRATSAGTRTAAPPLSEPGQDPPQPVAQRHLRLPPELALGPGDVKPAAAHLAEPLGLEPRLLHRPAIADLVERLE